MKMISAIPFFCVIMTSFSLPSRRNPSAIAFLRMRRSTNDLYAMSRGTQQRLKEAASDYCQLVYTHLLPRPLINADRLGGCTKIANYVLPMITTPELTRFQNPLSITQTTLASVLLAARRLNHTLTRLAAVGTEALLRPRRRGGMAACVSLTESSNPCLITCSASKTPERQLYCDLRAEVLPRLRNLVQLLQMQMIDASEEISYGNNHDVTATSSHIAQRLYALAVLSYSEKQMSLISERFRNP